MNHVWRWILEYIYMQYMHICYVKVKVLVTQLCLTLCNLMDCSPPGSSVHGILQARRLGLVAMPFSRGSSQPRDWTAASRFVGRFFTIWAISVYICLNNEISIYANTLRSSFVGLRININQHETKESWESQEPIFHTDEKRCTDNQHTLGDNQHH